MNQQLYAATASFRHLWQKHHTILYVSLLAALLAFAVFSFYQVLTDTLQTPPKPSSSTQTFDKKTVEKIKNLHVSTDSGANSLVFPTPRSNPFNE